MRASPVVRQAALTPQHIQLNLSTLAIELVNTSNNAINNYIATVKAVTPAGVNVWSFDVPVRKVQSHSTSTVLQRIPNISDDINVIFLELGLKNQVRDQGPHAGRPARGFGVRKASLFGSFPGQDFHRVDRNVYWLHKSAWKRGLKPARFQPMDEFHSLGKWASSPEGQAKLTVKTGEGRSRTTVGSTAGVNELLIEVECHKASCVAFFVRIEVGRSPGSWKGLSCLRWLGVCIIAICVARLADTAG